MSQAGVGGRIEKFMMVGMVPGVAGYVFGLTHFGLKYWCPKPNYDEYGNVE